MSDYLVTAFYKFVPLPYYEKLRNDLLVFCNSKDLKGSILLAEEGINSTLAGSEENILDFLVFLRRIPEFKEIIHKESWAKKQPFDKMKVRLKKEIVNLGQEGVNPLSHRGNNAKGNEWNDLLEDPTVKIIDTRNDYEIRIGTFKNTINPNTYGFKEFANWVEQNLDPKIDKKVGMFCTGGIRCEKASSYMLSKGFKKVIQLEGGILKYLEDTPIENSLWEGDCFVFDHRIAVNHDLVPQNYVICPGCGHVLDEKSREAQGYEESVSCCGCHDIIPESRLNRLRERKSNLDNVKKNTEKVI